jgi:hypothetical protein
VVAEFVAGVVVTGLIAGGVLNKATTRKLKRLKLPIVSVIYEYGSSFSKGGAHS